MHMRSPARRLAAVATSFALVMALAIPAIATATVTGGCTVTGTSTTGGPIDLTSAAEWHLNSTGKAGGSGTAPSPQTSASVGAYVLGLPIPIASGSGAGDTSGSVDNVPLSIFGLLGARFMVSGSSSGANGGCSGHVLIVLDDVNPLFTLFGGGGLAVAVIGALIVLLAMRMGGGIGSRIAGLVFGLLGAAGLGLAMAQFAIVPADSIVGLMIAMVGGAVGLLTPGLLHGSRT
jgi:hypothetical protein